MCAKELEFLVKGIMKSPKSYTLWHQRTWIIGKGLGFEREINKGVAQSKVLEMELKLCDKMLMRDERNFHCWNYRYGVLKTYFKEIGLRLEGEQETADAKMALAKREFEMAEGMIKKNFSNFSAWTFRTKLYPVIHSSDQIPEAEITKDLDLLKHAFFTDPKDQSPWNYHDWILS
jgi:geranylgeranyl transferase type-2 subunit alpha